MDAFGPPFFKDELAAAVALVNGFMESAQKSKRIGSILDIEYFEKVT